MSKVLFYAITKTQFDALPEKDANALYFLTDASRIYKGLVPFTHPVQVVASFPASGEVGTVYVKTGTYEAKVWNGDAWVTLALPVTTAIGTRQADTILSGVIYFMQTGSWEIAAVIFIASVFVPLAKLIILVLLLVSVRFRWCWRPRDRTVLYRLTELVGRWSMVDIYVVTILVALVRLGAVATIEAGPAAVYFAAVVVLTMFAAESFDPRLIWDALEEEQ